MDKKGQILTKKENKTDFPQTDLYSSMNMCTVLKIQLYKVGKVNVATNMGSQCLPENIYKLDTNNLRKLQNQLPSPD